MMVTATNVEAEPMGVKLPPRLAPKITAHQKDEPAGIFRPTRIFASTAASGILSVTELAAAEPLNHQAVAYLTRLSDYLFVMARHLNGGGKDDGISAKKSHVFP